MNDYDDIANIAKDLETENLPIGIDPWISSPFAWITKLPSAQRGKIGKQIITKYFANKGAYVNFNNNDCIINGHRVAIKFSTQWQNGTYKFQQIRDEDYDHLICIGISPFNAHCWIIPKPTLYQYTIRHTGQHTGINATETAWITFPVDKPPTWLTYYGGTLEKAWSILYTLGYGRH
jgi:hypothetical protein